MHYLDVLGTRGILMGVEVAVHSGCIVTSKVKLSCENCMVTLVQRLSMDIGKLEIST